jgi:hypothetical protein
MATLTSSSSRSVTDSFLRRASARNHASASGFKRAETVRRLCPPGKGGRPFGLLLGWPLRGDTGGLDIVIQYLTMSNPTVYTVTR